MRSLLIKIFFLALLAYSIALPSSTYAQEMPTPTPSPMFVKYDLAYPGILPDNPLYKLKVLRDKISLGLISDPQKKLDFYLLQTDKGILATAILVDMKKVDLAKETALKAEHNFTLLADRLRSLDKKPDNAFFKKLETASLKHQEVLNSLVKRVDPADAKIFQTVIEFSKRNWHTIEEYRKSSDLPK